MKPTITIALNIGTLTFYIINLGLTAFKPDWVIIDPDTLYLILMMLFLSQIYVYGTLRSNRMILGTMSVLYLTSLLLDFLGVITLYERSIAAMVVFPLSGLSILGLYFFHFIGKKSKVLFDWIKLLWGISFLSSYMILPNLFSPNLVLEYDPFLTPATTILFICLCILFIYDRQKHLNNQSNSPETERSN